ncbi:MAG: hypothetical protein EAZ85_06310 [Bacteroidetes bacterium]|nr:MAG: hypothetical protein EAZ85_06310 [Bacteroidota bacterium]TAG86545.1 MAG: hypothetical protein EAZ20_12570 [Bacteroidota bacterium]
MRCLQFLSLFFCCNLFLLNIIAQSSALDPFDDVATAIYTKNLKQAEFLLSQILAKNPKNLKALQMRAQIRTGIGSFKDAISDLLEATKLESGNATLYNDLGDCYYKAGEYALALVEYQTSNKIFGSDAKTYIGMVKCAIARGNISSAKEVLKNGKKIDKNNQTLCALEGYALLLEDQHFKAYEILNSTLQRNEKHPDVNYYLGLYHEKTNNYKQAIYFYNRAIIEDKFLLEAFIAKGRCSLKEGNYRQTKKEIGDLRLSKEYVQTNFRDNLELRLLEFIAEYSSNTNGSSSKSFTDAESLFNNIVFRKQGENFVLYQKVLDMILNYTKFRNESKSKGIESSPNIIGLGIACSRRLIQKNDDYNAHLNLGTLYYKIGLVKDAKKNLLSALDKAHIANIDPKEAENILVKLNSISNDQKGPTIYISSPAMASARGGILIENQPEKLSVMGMVADDSKISSVLVNGNPAKLNENGNFESEVYLKEGITEIKIIASDDFGNSTTHTFSVKKKVEKDNGGFMELKKIMGRKKAVILATDEYDFWSKLNNPINDAKELKRVLETNYGYEVEIVENPTQTQALAKLRQLAKAKYQPNDQLLLFYAGHGDYDNDTKLGYVILKDSKTVDKDPERTTWVSHTNVETLLAGIDCKHVGVIIDACFSGTFDKELALTRGDGNITDLKRYVNEKMKIQSRNFMTSGGKNYVSDGRPGKHSPFMEKLLEILTNVKGNAVLSWSDIAKDMKKVKDFQPKSGIFTKHEAGGEFLFLHEDK